MWVLLCSISGKRTLAIKVYKHFNRMQLTNIRVPTTNEVQLFSAMVLSPINRIDLLSFFRMSG